MPQRNPEALIGCSAAIKEIENEILRVSRSRATVLLRGESGTGKELVAKLIHQRSPCASGPFIRVSCAALSETLLESELFGHEKGAFTGAHQRRKGRFELANGGTLFLDEIGDIPLSVQVKLLRVLQEMSFERVGGNETLSVKVRILSATHRNLENAVVAETFRQDFYYRINVIPLQIPPLRERQEDIPLLVDHFLEKFNQENEKSVRLSPQIMHLFSQYDWPGNVRELENCLERLVVLAEEEAVTLKTIPPAIATYFNDIRQVTPLSHRSNPPALNLNGASLSESVEAMERAVLKKTLGQYGWVQAKAARQLKMTPRQMAYKIKKYRLTSEDPNDN